MSVTKDLKAIHQNLMLISPDMGKNRKFDAALEQFNTLTAQKSRSLYNIQDVERLNTNATNAHVLNFGFVNALIVSGIYSFSRITKWAFQHAKFKPNAAISRLFPKFTIFKNLWIYAITTAAPIAGILYSDKQRLENATKIQKTYKLEHGTAQNLLREIHTMQTAVNDIRINSQKSENGDLKKSALKEARQMLIQLNSALAQFQYVEDQSAKPVKATHKH